MEDEVIDATDERALALRRPDVPTTIEELAAMKGEALEVIDSRITILTTVRRAAIRLTSPPDYVLFKSGAEQGGQVTAYLQDCGADRVRDITGIEVYDVSDPVKVSTNDPAVFTYLITGSGRCKMTRQILERVEGGRSSTDDFCRGKTGIELELAVRKAARANLDGNITRELAGMKSIPIEDLKIAWEGTPKRVEDCRLGRGFGTRDERLGGSNTAIAPPVCPHCNATGVLRPAKGNRGAFYGCPNYGKHSDKKFLVDAAEWEAKQAKEAKAAAVAPEKPAAPAPAASAPLTADDVFGGGKDREPGQEG